VRLPVLGLRRAVPFVRVDCARAEAEGLRFRPAEQTTVRTSIHADSDPDGWTFGHDGRRARARAVLGGLAAAVAQVGSGELLASLSPRARSPLTGPGREPPTAGS